MEIIKTTVSQRDVSIEVKDSKNRLVSVRLSFPDDETMHANFSWVEIESIQGCANTMDVKLKRRE